MENSQNNDYPVQGKTTIAPEVLLTIVQLTTLDVPGVRRMSPVPGDYNKYFKRGYGDGVHIDIQDGTVYADLHLVFGHGVNIRDVGRRVQRDVARAITEMVGMPVGRINIHVEDIDYSDAEAAGAKEAAAES
ncbi:MAG: Asp23/Gls24 family envelope stress response protein [Chloroflexota bacterium]